MSLLIALAVAFGLLLGGFFVVAKWDINPTPAPGAPAGAAGSGGLGWFMEMLGVAMIIMAACLFYVICVPLQTHGLARNRIEIASDVNLEKPLQGVKYTVGDDEVSWQLEPQALWYVVHIVKKDGTSRSAMVPPNDVHYVHDDLKTAKRLQVQYGTEEGLSENPPVHDTP